MEIVLWIIAALLFYISLTLNDICSHVRYLRNQKP
jgi:hypothetical protein